MISNNRFLWCLRDGAGTFRHLHGALDYKLSLLFDVVIRNIRNLVPYLLEQFLLLSFSSLGALGAMDVARRGAMVQLGRRQLDIRDELLV